MECKMLLYIFPLPSFAPAHSVVEEVKKKNSEWLLMHSLVDTIGISKTLGIGDILLSMLSLPQPTTWNNIYLAIHPKVK